MIVIATARNASKAPPSPELNPGLALSYSPLDPKEGTATFQKPVAIKRIAPALVSADLRGELVTPFLEAARVVTGIQHSNVARILEVGQVGNDVFLVMDYLMGETAATLMRQLHSRGETLDFALAAHIIADASAGLEAAHSLGVLHAQLTPHDLFIGYDGTVRVLDIGIAAARGRLAGESGAVGLGLEYSSPENCRKEPLDRRSDVFSLGTMLWELITGISPFERAKEADTKRAICEEEIVAPRNLVPSVPDDVSTITMTALARDADKRYGTAVALRQALLAARRRAGPGMSPALDLSRLMKRLFETRIRDKKEMLRRIDSGASIAGLDIGETEEPPLPPKKLAPEKSNPPQRLDQDEPSVIIAPSSSAKLLPVAVPDATAEGLAHAIDDATSASGIDDATPEPIPGLPSARKRARPTPQLAWALGLLLALAGTVFAALGVQRVLTRSSPPPASSEPTPAVPVVASAPASVAPAPANEGPAPAAVDKTSGAVPVEEALLHIDTVPTHAMIVIAGTKKGFSPLDLTLPKSGDALIVEIRHAGYQTIKERVVPDVNQRLKLTLVAARDPAAAGSAQYHKFE